MRNYTHQHTALHHFTTPTAHDTLDTKYYFDVSHFFPNFDKNLGKEAASLATTSHQCPSVGNNSPRQ